MVFLSDQIVDDIGCEWDCMSLFVCRLAIQCLGFYEHRPFLVTGLEDDHVCGQPLVFLQLYHHARLQVFPVHPFAPVGPRDVGPVFVRVAAVVLGFHV